MRPVPHRHCSVRAVALLAAMVGGCVDDGEAIRGGLVSVGGLSPVGGGSGIIDPGAAPGGRGGGPASNQDTSSMPNDAGGATDEDGAGAAAGALHPSGGQGWSAGETGLSTGPGVPLEPAAAPLSLLQDRSCVACSMACSDDNACTFDVPNNLGQCLHFQYAPTCKPSAGCSSATVCDGDYCTGRAISCRDADPCTADACDPTTGACAHIPIPGCGGEFCDATSACPKGSHCTPTGRCAANISAFQPLGPIYAKPAGLRRFISYNTYLGLRGDVPNYSPARAELAAKWLAAMTPDVLALQELNGWTSAELTAAAKGWGHGHSTLHKGSVFALGLTAAAPIIVIAAPTQPYKVGMLHARIDNLDVMVVHLNAGSFQQRLLEAKDLGDRIGALQADGREVVVLGDFNAISPYDMAYYAIETPQVWFALAAPQAQPPGGVSALELQQLTGRGMIDVLVNLRSSPLVTASHLAPNAPWGLRVDHLFATPKQAQHAVHAWVADAPQRRTWSDHMPVVVDFLAK